jgi:signal transduction histidine kinase
VGQVINNLISNSIKFCNKGGKIDIGIRVEDNVVEVMVSDNGVGIPDSKKAILFTKFGQIDGNLEKLHSANPSSGSSGLGLFISRQIVDAHQGKIWLESSENNGTVAHFTLPLITSDEVAKKEEQTASLAN